MNPLLTCWWTVRRLARPRVASPRRVFRAVRRSAVVAPKILAPVLVCVAVGAPTPLGLPVLPTVPDSPRVMETYAAPPGVLVAYPSGPMVVDLASGGSASAAWQGVHGGASGPATVPEPGALAVFVVGVGIMAGVRLAGRCRLFDEVSDEEMRTW